MEPPADDRRLCSNCQGTGELLVDQAGIAEQERDAAIVSELRLLLALIEVDGEFRAYEPEREDEDLPFGEVWKTVKKAIVGASQPALAKVDWDGRAKPPFLS